MVLTVQPLLSPAGVPGAVCVRVRGSADIHSDRILEEALNKVLEGSPRVVILDLADVDILTSLAIGVLVGFRTRLMAGGGRVAVARLPESIAKTMKFTRVSELFPQYPTVDEAVARESARR